MPSLPPSAPPKIATPVNPTDAANKAYVDSAVAAALAAATNATSVAPGQVTQLTAGTPTTTTIPVSYTAPAVGTAPITYSGLTQVGSAAAVPNAGTFTAGAGAFTGLTAGTTYTLIIKATNAAGSSTTTLAGTVTTAAAVTPLPVINTSTTGATFVAGAAAGTVVAVLSAPPAGATRTLLPGDGRLTLNNAETAIVVGLMASSAGTISATVQDKNMTTGAVSPVLTVPVTVTAAASVPSDSRFPLSFAGPAGAPTGTLAMTTFNGSAPLAAVSLNGSGGAVLDGSDGLGTLAALGTVSDAIYTFAVQPGATDYRLLGRVTADNRNAYLIEYQYSQNKLLIVAFTGGGNYTILANIPSPPQPTANIGIGLNGNTISALVDGAVVGSVTDTSIPADGALGFGGTNATFTQIGRQTPAEADAAYAAANPPSMTITGVG